MSCLEAVTGSWRNAACPGETSGAKLEWHGVGSGKDYHWFIHKHQKTVTLCLLQMIWHLDALKGQYNLIKVRGQSKACFQTDLQQSISVYLTSKTVVKPSVYSRFHKWIDLLYHLHSKVPVTWYDLWTTVHKRKETYFVLLCRHTMLLCIGHAAHCCDAFLWSIDVAEYVCIDCPRDRERESLTACPVAGHASIWTMKLIKTMTFGQIAFCDHILVLLWHKVLLFSNWLRFLIGLVWSA